MCSSKDVFLFGVLPNTGGGEEYLYYSLNCHTHIRFFQKLFQKYPRPDTSPASDVELASALLVRPLRERLDVTSHDHHTLTRAPIIHSSCDLSASNHKPSNFSKNQKINCFSCHFPIYHLYALAHPLPWHCDGNDYGPPILIGHPDFSFTFIGRAE